MWCLPHPLSGSSVPTIWDACPRTATAAQDIIEQQSQVARVMRLLRTPTATARVAVLKAVQARLLKGQPSRYRHTLPSLVIAALELVPAIARGDIPLGDAPGEVCGSDPIHCQSTLPFTQGVQLDKLLLFVLHAIARLVELAPALTVLQLYLMAAQAASEIAKLELIAYECYEQVQVLLFAAGIGDMVCTRHT